MCNTKVVKIRARTQPKTQKINIHFKYQRDALVLGGISLLASSLSLFSENDTRAVFGVGASEGERVAWQRPRDFQVVGETSRLPSRVCTFAPRMQQQQQQRPTLTESEKHVTTTRYGAGKCCCRG